MRETSLRRAGRRAGRRQRREHQIPETRRYGGRRHRLASSGAGRPRSRSQLTRGCVTSGNPQVERRQAQRADVRRGIPLVRGGGALRVQDPWAIVSARGLPGSVKQPLGRRFDPAFLERTPELRPSAGRDERLDHVERALATANGRQGPISRL